MRRAKFVGTSRENPYEIRGVFGELPYWPGSLTALVAAPGVGKTSWMLRTVAEAAAAGFPAAFCCYEHTPDELNHRLIKQAEAVVAGAHGEADEAAVQRVLSEWHGALLMELDDRTDTVRLLEHVLVENYRFPASPEAGFALVVVDYLQRVPVTDITGLIPEQTRAGEAAAALRSMARRRGWAVVAISAARAEAFHYRRAGLEAILGDERVPYECDRVLWAAVEELYGCGCARWRVEVQKDRTGALRSFPMWFYGARFYPTTQAPCEWAPVNEKAEATA